ncbi:hypothetical protein QYM36_017714 [Artemia franciscana]|uniref:Nucleoprotein n=1 Tax=Artemia franciscana TaxID=6661 RepID=A0AA88L1A2_ARTSF|nr:hypothetical protein QYM36_017714 [Artemia franciscana]
MAPTISISSSPATTSRTTTKTEIFSTLTYVYTTVSPSTSAPKTTTTSPTTFWPQTQTTAATAVTTSTSTSTTTSPAPIPNSFGAARYFVQDGWLDPDDLYEVRRADVTEMPSKKNLQEFKKRIVNSKDNNVEIKSGSLIVDIEKCSKVAKLIPMAAELVFRTRGHHYITDLSDEYKQAYSNILKACLAGDIVGYFPPNYLFHKIAHFVSVNRAYDVIQTSVSTQATEVPRAIQIRAGATPAGTAVVCSSVAVIAQMRNKYWWNELYGLCKTDIEKIVNMNKLIKQDPRKWHINQVAYRCPRLTPSESSMLEDARMSVASLATIVQAYITATVDSFRGTAKSSLVGIKAIAKYAQTDSGTLRAMTHFFKKSFSSAGRATNLTEVLGKMSNNTPNDPFMD